MAKAIAPFNNKYQTILKVSVFLTKKFNYVEFFKLPVVHLSALELYRN